jgi:hypothetical protein
MGFFKHVYAFHNQQSTYSLVVSRKKVAITNNHNVRRKEEVEAE